jgi:hypothetical protein
MLTFDLSVSSFIDRKNAALTRQRTKAQIIDLQTRLNESATKNAMLMKINSDLVGQIELLKRENLALRQSLSLGNLQSPSFPGPFMSNPWPIDSSLALGLGQQNLSSAGQLVAGNHYADPLAGRLFPSSVVPGPGQLDRELQTQLLRALLLQQERDNATLRDHNMYSNR